MATDAIDFAGIEDSQVDQPVDNAVESQPQEQTDVQQPDEQQPEQQQDEQQQQLDGRRGPANIRASIKTASEQMPEHAQSFKELGNAYFREQAYRKEFATPAEAANAKGLIESVGGVDGISQLQERDQMYTAQDEFLRNGDPAILDDFFEDFPEGAASLAPHYLDKLATVNPQAFQEAIAPHAFGMLEQAGVGDYLKAIAEETDPARKNALAQRLSQWYEGQKAGVNNLKATRTQPNPGNDRISQREQQLQQREEQLFKQGVDSKVTASVEPKLNQVVEQYARKNRWNEEQKTEFRTRLLNDIAGQMDKDEGYKKQASLRYTNNSRTHDSVANYISNEFIRRMNDKDGAMATEAKVNKLFGRGTTQQPLQRQQQQQKPQPQPGGNGFVRIAAKPQDSQIDWNHKDAQVWFLTDKAKLKDGRLVTWKKPVLQ